MRKGGCNTVQPIRDITLWCRPMQQQHGLHAACSMPSCSHKKCSSEPQAPSCVQCSSGGMIGAPQSQATGVAPRAPVMIVSREQGLQKALRMPFHKWLDRSSIHAQQKSMKTVWRSNIVTAACICCENTSMHRHAIKASTEWCAVQNMKPKRLSMKRQIIQ